MEAVATQAIDLIDHIKEMNPDQRHEKLRKLDIVLLETLKRGEEKVALAKSTFDAVRLSNVCVCVQSNSSFPLPHETGGSPL